MRRVIEFSERIKVFLFLQGCVDLAKLNNQIDEIDKEGWEVISISANTDFFGTVMSYTRDLS